MAYGMEVVLGWPRSSFKEIQKYSKDFGVEQIPVTEKQWNRLLEGEGASSIFHRHPDLETIHKNVLDSVFPLSAPATAASNRHLVKDTPLGKREFATFVFEMFLDEEINDDPDQAVFGISLSGRYYPTFLDWKDPSGSLDVLILDEDSMQMVETARRYIVEKFPIFQTAKVCVVMRHY